MRMSDQWRATSRYQAQLADEAERKGNTKQAAMFRAESRENWHAAGQLDWEDTQNGGTH